MLLAFVLQAIVSCTPELPALWWASLSLTALLCVQALYIVESVENMGEPPSDLPVCAKECEYSSGPNTVAYVNQEYENDGFEDADENLT